MSRGFQTVCQRYDLAAHQPISGGVMRRYEEEAVEHREAPVDYERLTAEDNALVFCAWCISLVVGAVLGWTSCYLVYVL